MIERIIKLYRITCRNLTLVNNNLSKAQGAIEVRGEGGRVIEGREGEEERPRAPLIEGRERGAQGTIVGRGRGIEGEGRREAQSTIEGEGEGPRRGGGGEKRGPGHH